MRLLVLGGTQFVGKHIVAAALERGHDVSLFNRGRTNPDLFPDAEHLRGDRDGDLGALETGSWDAAIDVAGYVPRVVRDAAELLANRVGHYTFISSISVYDDPRDHGLDEDAPLLELEDPTVEEVTGETYGGLKVLCERAVAEALPGRTLVVRPGLVVGPDDPTGRFTYWPERLARGGRILAPGRPEQRVQFIDVRDLGAWIVRLVEAGTTGTFNGTGPDRDLTFQGLLDEAAATVDRGSVELTWVDEEFLLEHQVRPFADLPLWLPTSAPRGMLAVSGGRAVGSGLSYRPLAETVRDTLEWATKARERGDYEPPQGVGLSAAREEELLAAWDAREPE